ncbi:hypothetical protein IV56_GL001078 [Lacticaseibacillus saniviri JCM 17471 = DSM 24301]|uniref:Uncharacterized protein n=1 Tax=Lacticaseibacillus saniviri JCM 17471 = DSM 24301 TaxID=1293598 RepID=A0A0R2MT51_9LACO|nr:hypothetical protein IV56_GL001078 [Lacticaseibacillus saniviri JCM 17471 = DSM 24301]
MTKALHLLYHDKATIIGQVPVKDGVFDDLEPAVIAENIPAKVTLGGLKPGEQSEFLTDSYDAKLLIDVGIDVPAGAEITVTDINGKVTHYKRASRGYSGYGSHQEVAMVLDQKA